MQRYSTYRGLRSIVAAVLVVVVWGASADAQDETLHSAKTAAVLNLSPWQSYVHLFCEKTTQPGCCVTFWCGQQTGEPVTWDVVWGPGQIFTYWPGKTNPDGSAAGLEATLVAVGLDPEAARRRTTCVIRSDDPVEARAYTRLGGEMVPVANRADMIMQAAADAPADQSPSR